MSRYVSFGVLIAVILLLSIVFYQVMAAFVLPLFLATVLVVIFRPVHSWVLKKTKFRRTLACGITTGIVAVAVVAPVGIVGVIAFGEARQVFRSLTSGGIEQNLKRIRKSLNLEMPAATDLHAMEVEIRSLDTRNLEEFKAARQKLDAIEEAAEKLESNLRIPGYSNQERKSLENDDLDDEEIEKWTEFRQSLETARNLQQKLVSIISEIETPTASGSNASERVDDQDVDPDEPENSDAPSNGNDTRDISAKRKQAKSEYKAGLINVANSYDEFRLLLLGGRLNAYLKEIANPTPAEFEKYNSELIEWIKTNFLSLGGKASQFFLTLIFSGLIMMIAVYFFLADGSKMINSIKFLSPLDDRHEDELIEEFEKVSRAVVVATLVTAVVQGLLAGIGYYFAGVDAVFLLTLLTTLLALVPFVGAGSVWLPTCLYLYLIEERLVPAILLAIWGAAVVSTIDNFLKPLILHGQSNIHPLFALLSVLGGVTALGPIGILVGPMIVVFLQTLLKILQRELIALDTVDESADDSPMSQALASVVSEATESNPQEESEQTEDDETTDENQPEANPDESPGG